MEQLQNLSVRYSGVTTLYDELSHADPDSEFSDFAIKNSINRARITMDFKNFLFLFIQFFISYHKSKFYKVSNGSVDVEIRLSITSPYSEITPYL